MKKIEDKLHSSTDCEELAELNYAYAVGIFQAENWCWALTQYAKSSGWFNAMFQTIHNIEDLQNNDNGWDYKSSRSYMLQSLYNKVYACLDNAESLTKNAELAARCKYMRGVIDMDNSHKWQYYHSLMGTYANTKFVSNEKRHCDLLCDHR